MICHGVGESARGEAGDEWRTVRVSKMEGGLPFAAFLSCFHRTVLQENWPVYSGFLACLHNIRQRGKATKGHH